MKIIQYQTSCQKVDKSRKAKKIDIVLDKLQSLNWYIKDFLYHFFEIYNNSENRLLCSETYRWALWSLLDGTTKSLFIDTLDLIYKNAQ